MGIIASSNFLARSWNGISFLPFFMKSDTVGFAILFDAGNTRTWYFPLNG
jgi:hypothetical protein